MTIPSDAHLYLRPIWFADSPIGLDGTTGRIGQSLLWFQAYELTAMQSGRRVARETVPVCDFDAVLATLTDAQQARLRGIAANIAAPRPSLTLGERTIRFDVPQVMGILNMTPDSFSDGGKHVDDAVAAADAGFAMSAAGAAMVDVGGESTRPRAEKVWEGDEIKRVVPVIERLVAAGVPVSIDTRKAGVMEAALGAGAAVVNDISALLHDPRSVEVVARAGCPVVLMHAASTGDDPHDVTTPHVDAPTEIFDWLEARIAACVAAGIAREKIIVDPGLGFGKALADNLAIVNRLTLFHGLGVPLLLGGSRKRMIGALSNEAPASARLAGSLALATRGADYGANILRVHDVPETVQAVHVWRGLRDAAVMGG